MKKHVLKNGLNIILKSMPNTHSITVGMYVRAGTRYENDDDNGIVHFLEHLHFRQLGIISQEELYYNMESMGSTLRAATYYDFLKFSMKIHPRYLENCLDVFKNIISANNWNAENFQTEKEIVKVQINEAGFMFSNKHTIRASLFGNSNLSFGIMGNTETVDSIDLPRIIAYKEKVFNKNNLLLCVTGCFNSQDVKLIQEKLEKIDINDGKKYIPMDFPKLLYHRNPNIILNNDDWDYFDVNISFDIDYNFISIDELIILNCILGEGVGSRLQKCIREKMNYTSNIYSEIEMYEDFSMLHIKLSVQKKIFLKCIKKIFEIVNGMKYDINSKDLDVSLPFYLENQVFLEDDTEKMNFSIAYNSFILGKEKFENSLRNNDESIIRLTNVAQRIFTPSNTSIVVFGDCRGITKKSIREIVCETIRPETQGTQRDGSSVLNNT